ncbi:hypothetical protein GCM10020366_70690 [Saccharopolyspora gregorii]|uniref:Uncharacterized protein n=1 Tax=Saccharopolyspora gregorii TaxID=33914 RepID=A0ABP6S2Y8_9PSEU
MAAAVLRPPGSPVAANDTHAPCSRSASARSGSSPSSPVGPVATARLWNTNGSSNPWQAPSRPPKRGERQVNSATCVRPPESRWRAANSLAGSRNTRSVSAADSASPAGRRPSP